MAAPSEVTMKDLSGTWIMNKTLSDDADPVLALQGVPWLKRRAISWATVTLDVKEYTDSNETSHIDIESTATGGIKGSTELRTVDWSKGNHEDNLFGAVTGQNRWVSNLDQGESGKGGALDPFCKEGWLDEGDFLQSYAVSKSNGWVAEQIWGFAEIEGVRHHTRRVVVTKGDKTVKVRLVYDFQGRA